MVSGLESLGQPLLRTGARVVIYRTVGRPLINLDEIRYLRYMESVMREARRPAREVTENLDRLAEEANRLPGLTRSLLPAFSRAFEARDAAIARNALARLAISLEEYRAREGGYPASLAELEAAGWKTGEDPFSGKAYRYRKEGNGFIVWSLGPDLDDDDGRGPDPKRRKDYDVTFRCKR